MNDKAKQRQRIAEYIEEHGSITGRDASVDLGIQSFTKRISEMNRDGYPLVSVWETGTNKFGEHCRYKRWSFGCI